MVDDVRRRRCAPVVTWVEEGEARLMKPGREKKLAFRCGGRNRRDILLIAYVDPGLPGSGRSWRQTLR